MELNLPNKITISRILLTPLIILIYLLDFIPYNKLISAIIFIVAVCSDFIDGNIARKKNMVTNLGKFLDPIADKIVVASTLILLAIDKVLPAPYGAIYVIVVISREFIISGLRQIAVTNGVVIAADKWGKIKTIFQDISIGSLMVYAQFSSHQVVLVDVIKWFAFATTFIAFLLTIYSGFNYIVKNKQVFNNK